MLAVRRSWQSSDSSLLSSLLLYHVVSAYAGRALWPVLLLADFALACSAHAGVASWQVLLTAESAICVQQGVLTPFDRLDGFERKIQSGPAEAGQSADMNEPSAGATSVLLPVAMLCEQHVASAVLVVKLNMCRLPSHLWLYAVLVASASAFTCSVAQDVCTFICSIGC